MVVEDTGVKCSWGQRNPPGVSLSVHSLLSNAGNRIRVNSPKRGLEPVQLKNKPRNSFPEEQNENTSL